MAELALVGSDLIDLVNDRLLGYQGVISNDTLMRFLNEAKDEVWAILKNLFDDYFVQPSQFTDNTKTNFFGPMSTSIRQYTLPEDLREMRFIEILDADWAMVEFVYRKITDEDWRQARRSATLETGDINNYRLHYTIVGKDQMLIAEFPPFGFQQPVLWYTRYILDFEIDDTLDQTLSPYSKKMADYAAKKILLSLQDDNEFEGFKEEWKSDVVMIASSAAPRNQADPDFVDDFTG